MRRRPEAILIAHEFDPTRRELYVEGDRDREFFNWLTADTRSLDSTVIPIGAVEIGAPSAGGGNRERLLDFLSIVGGHPAKIRGFADRDHDQILGVESTLANATFTDFRDLESYVLFEENVDKVLRVGAGTRTVEAKALLTSTFEAASFFAALRYASLSNSWKLPVSGSQWDRHVKARKGILTVHERSIQVQLMQNAGISASQLGGIQASTAEARARLQAFEPRARVQGKDTMRLLKKQFASLGIDCSDAFHVLGPTFERSDLDQFSNLKAAAGFI